MPFPFINALDCLAFLLFQHFLFAFGDYRRRHGIPYPPGPPSRPIIGNLLDVPKEAPWVAYADMSKKYGDVLYLRVFGQVVIVLCSLSAVKDLLERRGNAYSDRPTLPIVEIAEMDWILANARNDEVWLEGRKLADSSLRPGTTASYRQMMLEKTHWFLTQLLATPNEFREHIVLLRGKLVMSLVYGYDLKGDDDLMTAPSQASKIMTQLLLPGAALVNNFPILKYIPSWVPWLSYEPFAQKVRRLSEKMKNDPINFVKNAMREGTAMRSLASEHLQEIENLAVSERQKREEIVKTALGSLYSVGAGTVQKRAQEELDIVVGRDRLPTFDDRPRLPYIDAICRELLRWQMVTPMGLPHASSEDDVYRGFFIPKGSIIVANGWAILHDPEIYPDPEEFKPERFLDKAGSFRDDPTIALAFGAGRRICPGRHLVDVALFIIAASVLSVFNVTKAKDENGHEIPLRVPMTTGNLSGGVVVYPEEFQCSITPRDKVAEDLILASALF